MRTTAGGTYTATVWVRADRPGETLKLRVREWSGSIAVGSAKSEVALTTSWQPVTVQYSAASAGSSTLDLSAYVTGGPPGQCFEADDASIAVR